MVILCNYIMCVCAGTYGSFHEELHAILYSLQEYFSYVGSRWIQEFGSLNKMKNMMLPIVIGIWKYDVATMVLSPTTKYIGKRGDGVHKNNEMLLNVKDTPHQHMLLSFVIWHITTSST